MSITIVFDLVQGDLDDIYNLSKVTTTKYTVTKNVPPIPTLTFRDLFYYLPYTFTQFWKVMYNGNILDWDEPIPQRMINQTVHLVAPMGHWSHPSYQANNPLLYFQQSNQD